MPMFIQYVKLVIALKRSKPLWNLTEWIWVVLDFLLTRWLLLIEKHILFKPVRFIRVPIEHVGHLASEVDCYFKEKVLGYHNNTRTLLLAPRDVVSNQYLLNCFKERLMVISNPYMCILLKPFSKLRVINYNVYSYAQIENGSSTAPQINATWGHRGSLWGLSEADCALGASILNRMGIATNDWYVCVHCREAGYKKWDIHDYRDASIGNYMEAIKSIVAAGGWCIRMGDHSMTPLPKMDRVIDYCHSQFKSPMMDVFLSATCRFFLGSSSGLYWVASIFGTPVASANCAPFTHVRAFSPRDLAIPKLYWSNRLNRLMTFKEILSDPCGDYRYSDLFNKSGIVLLESDSDEIRDLAEEMLAKVDNKIEYSFEDEKRQADICRLFTPGHFSYGSESRIGKAFLCKYESLLYE